MPVIPKTFTGERFETNPFDLFETDNRVALECVKELEFLSRNNIPYNNPNILDVGCGKGVWGRAARQTLKLSHLTGVDIYNHMNATDDDFKAPYPYDVYDIEDYLNYGKEYGLFDLIIGNPPFSSKQNRHLAEDIVLHSLDLLTPNGYLGLLLKTEFVASSRRYENIFKNHAPLYQYSLCPRPYWNDNPGSNTIEYSFFIWDKNENSETKLRWLNWK